VGQLNAASSIPVIWQAAAASLLIAFAVCHVIALAYVWSHRGLSYSKSFVQSLVLAGVAAATMMLVIGNNIVWGIGMVGAMALVRFRTNLRDSRDMIFVFDSLIVGLACGTRAYAVAAVATLLFSLTALYLSRMSFGFRNYFDAIVRFTLRSDAGDGEAHHCLTAHCSRFALTLVQEVSQGEGMEYVYQVRFRRAESRLDLVRGLEQVHGLGSLSLMLEESRVEI
jgi:hypothetical protein